MEKQEQTRRGGSPNESSAPFTAEDVKLLRTGRCTGDSAGKIERKTHAIFKRIEGSLGEYPWFDQFVWGETNGSPHVEVGTGPTEESAYLWLSMAHEKYEAVGGRTKGLQFEFGLTDGDKQGFFGRTALCGLYLGSWVKDPVAGAIARRIEANADEIAAHLQAHDDHVLHVGDRTLHSPSPETVREVGTELSRGLLLTLDLTLDDVCEDPTIVRTIRNAFVRLLPLYGVMAGIDELAELGVGELTETDMSAPDESERASPDEKEASTIKPTRESILEHSDFDEAQIEQNVRSLAEQGATTDEALEILRQYVVDMDQGSGLYAVRGLGPMTGYALERVGITTVDALAATPLEELRALDGIRDRRAALIREAATDRVGGSEPETEPGAEETGTAGEATSDESGETTVDNGARETAVSDEPVDVIVGDETDDVTVGDVTVSANALSEYYEAFRSLRKVLETVILSEDSPYRPDDLTDPLIQYYVVLDACIAFGRPDTTFAGYGPQHQRRLQFSIAEYRRAFGDGTWVTEYSRIDVEPFQPETYTWLRERGGFEDPGVFVRPVPPGADDPLPEVVTSTEELTEALTELGLFPVYPPVPDDSEAVDRTIPVGEIYQRLFAELNDEHTVDVDTLSGSGPIEPLEGAVAEATPTTADEIETFLKDREKLTHLFRRVDPPASSPIRRSVPTFALDWYQPPELFFQQVQQVAKFGSHDPVEFFVPRLQDLINRRFLQDYWEYDYITVFPGHEAGSLSEPMVEIAMESVVDTSIVYAPLLERTETRERQRGKSREERLEAAQTPEETLRCRSILDGETVVLLDDVCTTGSSLLAGAHALREAGADRVVALSLALTPGDTAGTREITSLHGYASEIIAGVER
ncbi:phosphoribosyltransferase family protein [Natrialbaceae archaeon A-chndr2]